MGFGDGSFGNRWALARVWPETTDLSTGTYASADTLARASGHSAVYAQEDNDEGERRRLAPHIP